MKTLMDEGLLDAVAADITAEGRPLACALLRACLRSGGLPRCSVRHGDLVVLLAAVVCALLAAVRTDWRDVSAVPTVAAHHTEVAPRPKLVLARQFQFAPLPASPALRLPRMTYEWLSALPVSLVQAVVRWAPPVVAPVANPDSPIPVLGNLPAAFLARQVTPDARVWVRVLKHPALAQFSLPDLAAGALPQLGLIVAQHRNRIVRAAPTAQVAERLTGLQRAMVFRIRQQYGRSVA